MKLKTTNTQWGQKEPGLRPTRIFIAKNMYILVDVNVQLVLYGPMKVFTST